VAKRKVARKGNKYSFSRHAKLKTVKGNAGFNGYRDIKVISEVIRANT